VFVRDTIIYVPRFGPKSSTVEVQYVDRVCCDYGAFDGNIWGHHHIGMTKPDEAVDWLKNLPGYRELIKQRIHVEQKRRYLRELKMTTIPRNRKDVDQLGREIDGCG